MRRKAPPQRHPLVHISRGRDPAGADARLASREATFNSHSSEESTEPLYRTDTGQAAGTCAPRTPPRPKSALSADCAALPHGAAQTRAEEAPVVCWAQRAVADPPRSNLAAVQCSLSRCGGGSIRWTARGGRIVTSSRRGCSTGVRRGRCSPQQAQRRSGLSLATMT